MTRRAVRITSKVTADLEDELEYAALTPAERVAMMRPLAERAYAVMRAAGHAEPTDDGPETGLPRRVVRVQRRRG